MQTALLSLLVAALGLFVTLLYIVRVNWRRRIAAEYERAEREQGGRQ